MKYSVFSKSVSLVQDESVYDYCLKAPFDPPEFYNEIPFIQNINKENKIYPMIRSLLQNLGLDKENIGTRQWNPLKKIIAPGNVVLIKPNLITHRHYLGEHALFSSIIHGSFLRPIIDYAFLALDGKGKVIIADNPIVGTDFKSLMDFTGIQAMTEELRNRGYQYIEVIDLRPKILKERKNGEFYYESQNGDPLGYVEINLGKSSLFSEFDDNQNIQYYTLADPSVDHIDPKFKAKSETDDYHNPYNHKYVVSKTALRADTFINIAKMKTHCKAGVTLALKNVIGTVFGKGCMPHWRQGLPPDGDAFPTWPPAHYVFLQKLYVKLRKSLKVHRMPGFIKFRNYLQKKDFLVGQYKHLSHGNWKGNDTIWRTILDLNRIMFYADIEGNMCSTPQRKILAFIDGVIAQQGEGPMNGKPITSSIIIGGFNPVVVDALGIKTMGINPQLIKSVCKAKEIERWKLILDDGFDVSLPGIDVPIFDFELPKGWK